MADETNQTDQQRPVQSPGNVIVPGGSPQSVPSPVSPQPQPRLDHEPIAPPQSAEDLLGPLPTAPIPTAQPTDAIHYDENGISWTASEFIAHEKSSEWYIALAGGTVVVTAIIYLLTKDVVSASIVPIVAVFFGIYGARKPRQLAYRVDDYGVQIGQKHYPFENYKSFAVMPEGAFSSITFMPLKRFAPTITIYFGPQIEDDIIALLSEFMPGEVRQHDLIDQLMRRLRF